MANIETHPPGSFCWLELATSDQNAAKQFYSSLLGWKANDMPTGSGAVYTIFDAQGRAAAAAYTMHPERERGIPPHWSLYISTPNADETAAKAVEAGGKICAPAFDVGEFGRMAILQDPAGVSFCAWQPKTNPGIRIAGVPGAFCWADLMTPDADGAARFYAAVFGWKLEPGKDGSGYLHIKNGDQYIGGIPPAESRNPNAPPHWLLYFMAKDCDAATTTATKAGARVYLKPMTVQGVGRWSVLSDPQGAVFALFQSLEHK
jgi:predicted enzyme related to lactoylglutathione lyase